jgi:hypothetical protein
MQTERCSSLATCSVFRKILLGCDEGGLSGREMCALEGVKLPSNASQEWRGTQTALQQKGHKRPAAVAHLVSKHRTNAARDTEGRLGEAAARQVQTLPTALATLLSDPV